MPLLLDCVWPHLQRKDVTTKDQKQRVVDELNEEVEQVRCRAYLAACGRVRSKGHDARSSCFRRARRCGTGTLATPPSSCSWACVQPLIRKWHTMLRCHTSIGVL